MIKQLFTIYETKPIHKNHSFWLSVLVFPLIAILFALPIALNETSGFCFSSKCYEFFYQVFTFPLWLSTGSLIFGVMYTRLHSSKQNAAKLALDYREETYKRYFDHRDKVSFYGQEFLKLNEGFFKKQFDSYYFDFDRFYKTFFPSNSPSKGFSFESPLNGGDFILDLQIARTDNIISVIESYEKGVKLKVNGMSIDKTLDQFNHDLHGYIHSFAYGCFISTSRSKKPETITTIDVHSILTIMLRFLRFMFERCELNMNEEKIDKAHKDMTDKLNDNYFSLRDILALANQAQSK
ncbi:hypothetical protein SG34_023955 [Thalassomonas viridans]|uniref:Uncharacterized protein n=1 Tax=Thalassomonas viridans TaxID=137584 RepID=A0AAE9Z037_9GAMM|nr:hypothetical protein [Thalassomonas viridans]WDE04361.1 hypothetical protein SG34_023955 [Thalassomonas viridans]